MRTIIELPTPPPGKDRWEVSFTFDRVPYRIIFFTNKRYGGWFVDLYSSANEPLVLGVALVSGIDLLLPYRYRAIPQGILYVLGQDPDLTAFAEGRSALRYLEVEA